VLSSKLVTITSVTRWLIVVVFGCVVLETTQPMTAAESDAPSDGRSAETVIFPKGSAEAPRSVDSDRDTGGSKLLLVGAFLLALGGGWLLLRRRGLPLKRIVRNDRLIVVEETKSLGNRQYLVVAGCEGRRFLLGVTPGRIQLLTPLDDRDDVPAISPEL
jgi:flagellar protein FliO/FliZ